MSNDEITQLVAIGAAVLALLAFVSLVTVPAVGAYQRAWERIAAALLSLWVFGALVGVGVVAGAAVVYFWPRLF